MKVLAVEFVKSAAGTEDLPREGLPEIALVGRSNVGKSSLINALVRTRIARTSAAPGKTRLANLYRVRIATGDSRAARGRSRDVLYFVDLPGYGYARGGERSAQAFEQLTAAYFSADPAASQAHARRPALAGVILAVDARHPGLAADDRANEWLSRLPVPIVRVATKVDRMSRGERERALRALQTRFDGPVQPVSAATGEGLDELWKQIIRLCNRPRNLPQSISPR